MSTLRPPAARSLPLTLHNTAPAMSSKTKGGKLTAIINYRVRVVLNDSRALVGQLLAFDKHMNLVLAECDEFRRVKRRGQAVKAAEEDEEEDEMKRTLGLVILRGETIVTLSVEGPPPAIDDKNIPGLTLGPGFGAPAGRGMGLAAPPTMRQAPQTFAPPPGMPGGMPPPPPGFAAPPGFMPPPGFAPR
ncbi:Like-Sm (LSM) domain-containing protein [Rhodotorula toruloides]|uniref:Sm protein B n=1 Tax=Rhodotorula toruloides TaxID=5286 RepID=A0A2T0A2P0_RHOTO|nr:Like-Sm (LSM) domain-containing protein [Rhodotorula toruloides]